MRPSHGRYHQQRTNHCASLVHDRVQPESPSVPHFLRRSREQDIPRRAPERLARALKDNQDRCGLPVLRKRQRRHCNHVHRVAEEGDGPIGASAIGESPRKEAQASPQHLTNTGNDGNLQGRGPQILQVRPDDAVRPLVRHVGEQAYDAQADDETERRRAFTGGDLVRTRFVPHAAMLACHG